MKVKNNLYVTYSTPVLAVYTLVWDRHTPLCNSCMFLLDYHRVPMLEILTRAS